VCRRLSTTPNSLSFVSMAIIYIDDEAGTDAPDIEARGTEAAPFKSLPQAYLEFGPDHEYHVKKKDEEYKPAAKSALKKAVKYAEQQQKKRDARAEKEAQDKAALEATIERAKNIKITQDPALPEAVLICLNETNPSIIGRLRKSGQAPKTRRQRTPMYACVFEDVFDGLLSREALFSSSSVEDWI
jgi:asparaginyl-tRNA synthetase